MSINIEYCGCGAPIKQENGVLKGYIKKDAAICPNCRRKLVYAFKKDAHTNPTRFGNFVENMAKTTGFTVAQLCSLVAMSC